MTQERIRSLMQQGLELADKGDLFGAIGYAEQLIKEFPDFHPGLCLLGDLYLQVGSPALAIDPLEKAVAAAPQNAYSQFLLGCGLGRTGNLARAIHHLEIADRLRPNNTEILRNLGWMKSMSGNVKKGRQFLRKSIKLDSKNSLAYNDLGASYMFADDVDPQMAKRYIGKALDLDPENKFIQNTWKSFQELFQSASQEKAGKSNRP